MRISTSPRGPADVNALERMFDHYYCILQLFHVKILKKLSIFAKINVLTMVPKLTLANIVLNVLHSGPT